MDDTIETSFWDITILWDVKLLGSVVLLILYLLVRMAVSRWMSKAKLRPDTLRMWQSQSNTFLFFLMLVGAFIIWGSEIKDFALSIAALAVALVLSLKELILCFVGGLYVVASRPFRVGDRIGVSLIGNHVKGDVLKITPLCVRLQEIGPGDEGHQFTGRKITLPNSVFLSGQVFLESPHPRYHLHSFTLGFSRDQDLLGIRDKILVIAKEKVGSYQDKAAASLRDLSRHDFVEVPSVEPRVSIVLPDEKSARFLIRIPVPSKQSAQYQAAITNDLLKSI